MSTTAAAPAETFTFPARYSFPPFFTPQPTQSTRHAQLSRWSTLIQQYCAHHKLHTLTLQTAINTPLFHNTSIKKRLSLPDARAVIDYMVSTEGDQRAEWLDSTTKGEAWIWWRKPEEWGSLIAGWVEETGQKGVVLTLYEIVEGEGSVGREFHGLDMRVLQKALAGLVKKGRAQVFGGDGGEGVKFF